MGRGFALAMLAFLLPACASIVEGTDQAVTVQTRPPGAQCDLTRDGSQIAVVNPTPGTVTVDKSKHDITVRCSKEGHEDGAGVLASSFEGMTAGNVIFGGLIGLAVDASSGAMHDYPPMIEIYLREIR